MMKIDVLNLLNSKKDTFLETIMRTITLHKETIIIIAIIAVLYLVIMKTSKNPLKRNLGVKLTKKDKRIKKGKYNYFRDIPCDGDIFKAYFIATLYDINENVGDLLGAVLLKWMHEEKIEVIEISTFTSSEDAINLKVSEEKSFQNQLEERLYKILLSISVDGILEFKELKNWLKDNPAEISGWFDIILAQERGYLIRKGDLIPTKGSIHKKYKIHDNLQQEAYHILGFKKFLLDFSEIEKKESKQSYLWEEYLIFAQMLGIANKVEKEFDQLYPNLLESINRLTTYPIVLDEEDEPNLDKYQF